MAFETPLQAHVVDGHVFVCTPDGLGEICMTAEAVLASLDELRGAAEQALLPRAAEGQAAA